MCRIIIGDAVNVQLLRRCPVNSFEEFEELLMTVPRHALADNLAFQGSLHESALSVRHLEH